MRKLIDKTRSAVQSLEQCLISEFFLLPSELLYTRDLVGSKSYGAEVAVDV